MSLVEWFKSRGWRTQYGLIALVGSAIYSLAVISLEGVFTSWPVYQQFFFIAVPVYIVLGFVMSNALGNGLKRLLGVSVALMLPELLTPPYLVSLAGEVSTPMLGGASLEIVFATFLQGLGKCWRSPEEIS